MPTTIGVLREATPNETRVALVPEVATKFKAAGGAAGCLAKVYTKALQKGLNPDGEALTKCQTKFRSSCIKAETDLDDCTNVASCTETQAVLLEWVATVWNKQCVEKDQTIPD